MIEKLQNKKQFKKIKLTVVTKNENAIELYKKAGFEIVGELKKELKINGVYYDEYMMEMFF